MFHSQIALTKKGYSANPAWEPLTDEGDIADEDAAGSPDVKRAPLRSSWYDVRSPTSDPCVKEVHIQGKYTHYECKKHSLLCKPSFRCKAPEYEFIPELNANVNTAGCKCKEDSSGRKLNLERKDAF